MKLLKQLFILFGLCAVLSSCGDVTEDIYINKEGKGTVIIQSDVLAALEGMAGIMGGSDAIKDRVWEGLPGGKIDSVIDMKSIILMQQQELSAQQEKILDRLNVYIRGSKATNKLVMGADYNFNSINELNELNTLGTPEGEDQQVVTPGSLPTALPFSKSRVMSLEKNVFKCVSNFTNSLKDMDLKERAMANQMLKDGTYTLRVHTKSKIIKAVGSGLVSFNDSIATFKYELDKITKGKQQQNFEITLQ